jgi:tetratricopeptide (TPR) repeat protein
LAVLYQGRDDLKAADEAFKKAADLSPLRSPIRLRYIDFKLRTGALDESKPLLQEITAKHPDYLPPRVLSMRIACAEHQDDDCAAKVQNILAQDPINYDAVFQDGLLSLAKGDNAKAIREFEYLSNTYTRNPLVRYQLALAYLASAKDANPSNARSATEAAESRLNEAIGLDPHYEPAVLLFAGLKIRKGAAAAAVDALVELLKQRPQSAQGHYLLATAYLAQQQRDQALQVYRQMTERFPNEPQPWFLIGTILFAQNQPAEARKAFEKSTEIGPDYLPPVERLVDLDIADKQYAAALDRVQKHIDKDPKAAQAWALRGKVYLAQQDFAHAEPDLLKAIELDPKLEPAYLLLTQLYVATNKQDQAIAKLNAFVEKNKDVPALMQLAMINEQLKNYAAARDAYESVLAVSTNFLPALNNLAVIYSERLGQLDKAYELARKARDAAPNEPHAADTLGWITFKKGDYANALPLLAESAGRLPDLTEIQFHLAMAQYMLGQEGPARAALQKAVEASGNFPAKEEARARLALLAIDPATADAGARANVENYLRQNPNDPAALARLAALQQRDGKPEEAIKTYEKIIAGDPLYAPATRQLALLYAERPQDVGKAYDLASKARQAYPDDEEVARTLGILSYRRNLYPQAVELLKQSSGKRKDDAEALYYLGEAHYQLKQWSECKAALERTASLRLPASLADAAKRTLGECTDNIP